jgi:AcrR family transcriptional regulator
MERAKKTSSPRRHPEGGGYSRGDEVRSRIITVALETFALQGYEGASTRTIAELAGVNAPALQYYFGGKHGLYVACANHIAESVGSRLSETLAAAKRALANKKSSKDEILVQMHGLLSEILDMLVGPDAKAWALFVFREHAHPTEAFDNIYDKTMGPVIRTCAALVARLRGLPDDDPEAAIMALALYGQLTSFRFGREAVLRTLGAKEIDDHHRALIKSSLLRQLTELMR